MPLQNASNNIAEGEHLMTKMPQEEMKLTPGLTPYEYDLQEGWKVWKRFILR